MATKKPKTTNIRTDIEAMKKDKRFSAKNRRIFSDISKSVGKDGQEISEGLIKRIDKVKSTSDGVQKAKNFVKSKKYKK